MLVLYRILTVEIIFFFVYSFDIFDTFICYIQFLILRVYSYVDPARACHIIAGVFQRGRFDQ